MNQGKAVALKRLVPKSYHFDGYNEINRQNSRDKPFFSQNTVSFGERYYLHIKQWADEYVILNFESPCGYGMIAFGSYHLSFDEFVSKLTQAIQDDADFITFKIPVKYGDRKICAPCLDENEACMMLLKTKPKSVMAAVSFNMDEVKDALARYHGIVNNNEPIKGGFNMKGKKNFFGMNFEYGRSRDVNLASTLMGVAVRNSASGNWYVFDSANNTRKNLANLKMGNFPIFLLPVTQLAVGDLTKIDGQYYYVQEKKPNNSMVLVSAADGFVREMIPEQGLIPGMSIQTKVVAFDINSLTNPSSKENMGGSVLAAMCMMGWADGGKHEFSLDNIQDDSFNGLGACLPMLMAANNGGDFGSLFKSADGSLNLTALMMLGSGSGENDMDNMMQLIILQQLIGGGLTSMPNILGQNVVIPGVPATPAASAGVVSDDEVECEKCGMSYPAGTNFCPKCGSKTISKLTVCRACGVMLMKGASFCHKCGTKATLTVCSKCNRVLGPDELFCMNCGTKAGEKAENTDEDLMYVKARGEHPKLPEMT